MKKFYLFVALTLAAFTINAQCTIDTTVQTRAGIGPAYYNLPCLVVSQPYNQTLQVKCPTYFDTVVNLVITTYPVTVTVDSIELDSISNLPAGITWSRTPTRLAGGQNGCLNLSGTPTGPTGYYSLGWFGTAWVTEPYGLGKKAITGNLNRYAYTYYYLSVINAGDSCIPYNPYGPNGINELNPDLNTALSVYPNPSNGAFTLKLNAGSRINGQLEVIDITGRIVFTQDIDLIGLDNVNIDLSKNAKGIYTILLKTANGNATKRIVIE